jgi:hypothetical protein
MNKSANAKALKRLNILINSNKPNDSDSTKKARWDFNKEYGLNFHDKTVSDVKNFSDLAGYHSKH